MFVLTTVYTMNSPLGVCMLPSHSFLGRYTGVYWSGTTRIGGVRTAVWTAKIRRRSGRREAIIGSYHSEKVKEATLSSLRARLT